MEQVGNLVPSLLNSGAERDLPVASRQSPRPPGQARRGAGVLTGPMPVNGYGLSSQLTAKVTMEFEAVVFTRQFTSEEGAWRSRLFRKLCRQLHRN